MLASLAAFAGQAAVVYKWTDADGVIHYSDQPVPGAEKIYTAGSTGPAAGPSPNVVAQQAQPRTPVGQRLNYARFSITSPTPDQTFFGDDVIAVQLALEPGLKPDQTLTWHLNGRQLDDQGAAALAFALPRLDRGTYVLAATITDQSTGESLSTDSVNFFVRQPSELAPLRPKP